MNEIERQLAGGLHSGLLDRRIPSPEGMRPRLVLNDRLGRRRVADVLNTHLRECSSFSFSVAFLTKGGLATLLQALLECGRRRVKGRILTSDYLNFTDPRAVGFIFHELAPTIEVRVYTAEAFHTKGYLFEHAGRPTTLIIGSSNITQDALLRNHEWNLQVAGTNQGQLIQDTKAEFERLWEHATIVSEGWLEHYARVWDTFNTARAFVPRPVDSRPIQETFVARRGFELNSMQKDALARLDEIRSEGRRKALLVSATGTGKTILAASDVNQVKPERFLFIIHREQIARDAMLSFMRHLDEPVECALLTGSDRNLDAPYLFATIQTLAKDEVLHSFDRDWFDYIVVDEAHHAPAASYRRVLEYFRPAFLLGMTATPVRPDGEDVHGLFGNTVAAEITLSQALEEDLLAPFHYFGITGLSIDGSEEHEVEAFSNLEREEQIKHLSVILRRYSLGLSRRRGLIFTSTNDDAAFVARELRDLGVRALQLSGANSQEEREEAFDRLEAEEEDPNHLEYLVSVDIFNEGVDIPSLNQIIMLRPTESVIVFTQQLGRGLRKYPGKEFLTVIDFVGNHRNNYMIPIALFGENSYDKDILRRVVFGGAPIPGVSTVSFDRIAKERILDSITRASFSNRRMLAEAYQSVKNRLGGRIPSLVDFIRFDGINPELFIHYGKTWAQCKAVIDPDFTLAMNEIHLKSLRFLSLYLPRGIRIHETYLLTVLPEGPKTKEELFARFETNYGFVPTEASFASALRILGNGFVQDRYKESYGYISYVEERDGRYFLSREFSELLQNDQYRSELDELLALSSLNHQLGFAGQVDEFGLVRGRKYTRREACRVLAWEQDESNTIYGYTVNRETNTCPIFVTYHKHEEIDASIDYDDRFIDHEHFAWQSRTRVRLGSKEMRAIRDPAMKKLLFVKKNDDEGRGHYYLGELLFLSNEQGTLVDDKGIERDVVNVLFRLRNPVEETLYDYITDGEGDEAVALDA
ncbi:MAG: DEAD/DEAH box helicase [Spirochaetales bacterium]|nr:DEAD/DEAH box helicase [Spirochaetales bacterium]